MAIVKASGFCIIFFAEILFSMGAIIQSNRFPSLSEIPNTVDTSVSWETKVFLPPGNYPGKPNIPGGDNNIIDTQKDQTFEGAIKDMDKAFEGDNDPCSMVNVPSKNFMVEGRRISEAKCLQHIWEVKKEEETTRRVNQCMAKFKNEYTSVVGGRDAEPGEFPHMGALGWKRKEGDYAFMCGSFLISEKFVLTAAHCYRSDDEKLAHPTPKIVRFGVENIIKDKQTPVDVKILEFRKHPSYRPPPYKTYDIAVVELAKRVKFNKFIQPACLLNQQVDSATVTGWGVVDTVLYSTNTSDKLKVAEVDIVPTKRCNKLLRAKRTEQFWKAVRSDQICATRLNGSADACGGDSGGPLQSVLSVNTKKTIYNVIGVTSFGFKCGVSKFPSIYTRVNSYIDWIEEQVWGSHERQFQAMKASGVNVQKVQHFTEGDLFWLNKQLGRWSYVSHDFPELNSV
ncbi:serine protease snake-like [Pectinophora gossypiella]|uniref:serine protease snake-like n=1 Tax=Pectinophora gossypiella TaxID=13191 RepID=UPI00214F0033|nr:serine protease snake-like [Pectinophora gossypiella]